MTEQNTAPSAPPIKYDPYPPIYGATFSQAVGRYFEGFARGRGRASKSEYWWAYAGIFGLLIIGVALIAGGGALGDPGLILVMVGAVVALAAALGGIGTIALSVRRLHDANLSGWWYLLAIVLGAIPIVGFLPTIVIGLLPTNPAGVRFGYPDVVQTAYD